MAGYWVIKGTVKDNSAYQEDVQLWKPIAERFEASVIAGGGAHDTREGTDFDRVFIIEFPSYDQARACYDDPDYRAAMKHALHAYDPEQPHELVIVEGH
jgi:uncharacterized protein (DUF1330 family)